MTDPEKSTQATPSISLCLPVPPSPPPLTTRLHSIHLCRCHCGSAASVGHSHPLSTCHRTRNAVQPSQRTSNAKTEQAFPCPKIPFAPRPTVHAFNLYWCYCMWRSTLYPGRRAARACFSAAMCCLDRVNAFGAAFLKRKCVLQCRSRLPVLGGRGWWRSLLWMCFGLGKLV